MVEIKWINSEELTEENSDEYLSDVDGIIVPGGFGSRGLGGMIEASRFSREHNIPYFGICLGMQIGLIEIARNALGFRDAHTTEVEAKTTYPIIDLMDSQKGIENLGGTLRLGNYDCLLEPDSKVHKLYGEDKIVERHRHRYEFNNKFRSDLRRAGVQFVGINEDLDLVEIIELKDHPYYVACQFHPEFKSRPNRPHPLFVGFVKAAFEKSKAN